MVDLNLKLVRKPDCEIRRICAQLIDRTLEKAIALARYYLIAPLGRGKVKIEKVTLLWRGRWFVKRIGWGRLRVLNIKRAIDFVDFKGE